MSTGIVDWKNPRANMYGCLPCPKCGSKKRWPTRPDAPKNPNSVVCDDCGFVEPLEEEVGDERAD